VVVVVHFLNILAFTVICVCVCILDIVITAIDRLYTNVV
jgi:hypothetical protein